MSIRVPLLASLEPPLPERDCKGTTFFFPSKSFRNFFRLFFAPDTAGRPGRQPKPLSGTQLRDSGPRSDFFGPQGEKLRRLTDAQTPGEEIEAPDGCATAQRRNRGARRTGWQLPNKKIITRTDRRPHTEKDMPSTDGRHCVAPEGLSQEMPRLPIWGKAGQMEDAGPT